MSDWTGFLLWLQREADTNLRDFEIHEDHLCDEAKGEREVWERIKSAMDQERRK